MRDDLMAVQIEVDPLGAAATFWAAKQVAIESARLGEVADRKCQMKWMHGAKRT
jgi:hypothetical protein